MQRLTPPFVIGVTLVTAGLWFPAGRADSETPAVEVSTDKTHYHLDEPVTVTVKNQTGTIIYLVLTCRAPFQGLYQYGAEGWVKHGAHPTKGCQVSFQPVRAGEERTYTVDLNAVFSHGPATIAPGRYRSFTVAPGRYMLELERTPNEPPPPHLVGAGKLITISMRSNEFAVGGVSSWR